MKKELFINPKISLNNFDIIRFFLATSVIYCHCFVIFLVVYIVLLLQTTGYILPYTQDHNLFFNNIYHYPRFTIYFLSGACVYIFRNTIIRSKSFAIIALAAAVSSFIWIKCVDQVLPIAGTYLLFYVAYHPGMQFYFFSKKGDYSYGLYLYAWPTAGNTALFGKSYEPFSFIFYSLSDCHFFCFCKLAYCRKQIHQNEKKEYFTKAFFAGFLITRFPGRAIDIV